MKKKFHVISPRSYVHEATLFINPSKNNKIIRPAKVKKPSLILSILIVFVTFISVLGFSFLVKASTTYWNVDHESDEEWINIDAFGIVSENMLAISMNKERCNELDVN